MAIGDTWLDMPTLDTGDLVTADDLYAIHNNITFLRNLLPTGVYVPFGGTTPPTGWLLCDGAAISRTTYAALFAVIGTAFGAGDGATTFNTPDLRGRIPAGLDDMGTSAGAANRITDAQADIRGGACGEEKHALTGAENGPHQHSVYRTTGASGGYQTAATDSSNILTVTSNAPTASSGSGTAHNNVQPTIFSHYIIKT